jgi:hypothetical protein
MARVPTPDELNSMSEDEFKVAENRARRMAQRQGLKLEKCSRRDPWAIGYGTYQLVCPEDEPTDNFGLTLADVYKRLTTTR